MNQPISIAVLDDYQGVALTIADWSQVQQQAKVTVFRDHLADETALIQRLQPFTVVCVMRERTPLTQQVLSALPNLKLVVSTGSRNASIDMPAAEAAGITVRPTGYLETGAPELTWALLMALARHVPEEQVHLKNGDWQQTIGTDLSGKTIGIVGLGRIGSKIAAYAKAFDMNVLAWSPHLTDEKATAAGTLPVSKADLFRQADFITVHLVLGKTTTGIIGSAELSLMKPTAYLINTSRGPLIEEEALLLCLQGRKIAGAALDVFDREPLPPDHPFRQLDNVLATPHIGYVTENTYRLFYGDTVKTILAWLESANKT